MIACDSCILPCMFRIIDYRASADKDAAASLAAHWQPISLLNPISRRSILLAPISPSFLYAATNSASLGPRLQAASNAVRAIKAAGPATFLNA
jgi:hypothetical protein